MASTFEALLLSQINFLLNPPLLSAQDLTGTTSLGASGVATKVKLPTVSKDSYSGWNASTSTYTVPVAGTYAIGGVTKIQPMSVGASSYCLSWVEQNGSQIPQSTGELPPTANGWDTAVVLPTIQVACSVGDTINLWAQQGTSVAVSTDAGCSLEIRWVHQ